MDSTDVKTCLWLQRPVKTWTTPEVRTWLESVEDWSAMHLKDVPQTFENEDIDGHALILLRHDDLVNSLGIIDEQVLSRMYQRIKALKETCK
jgi:SAM domain (Sterile alpha motif)